MVESTNQSNVMTGGLMTGEIPQVKINSISFTAKGDFFTVGTSTGFMVYQTEPYKQLNSTPIEGGVRTVHMLSCEGQKIFVALVGSGLCPKYPRHKIVFWEAGKPTGASEINFADTLGVISVRSVGGIIVAGLQNHIRGFMLRDFSKIFQINTCENPKGLFAISSHEGVVSVASPNIQPGTVHFTKFRNGKLMDNMKPLVIAAHQNAISAITLNRDGSFLATMSD